MNAKMETEVEAAQEAPPGGGLAANLEISASRQFPAWLAEHKVSFAFTTYQAGKLFMVGVKEEGRLSLFERTFSRCMGLWGDGQTLWMSSLYQLWRFDNALQPGQLHRGYDRLYVPQVGYTTGDLDIHDVAVTGAGEVLFVNTLFGCLASLSETHSFTPGLEAALHLPPRRRRPLPSERPRHGTGRAPFRDGREPERRGRRLARPAPRRWLRDRRAQRRRDCHGPFHAGTRPASTVTSCGFSIRAPAISDGSTVRPARSSPWPPAPAICGASVSSRISPSSACRSRATTPSPAWRSTITWRRRRPSPGEASWSSTCARGTSSTGCASRGW